GLAGSGDLGGCGQIGHGRGRGGGRAPKCTAPPLVGVPGACTLDRTAHPAAAHAVRRRCAHPQGRTPPEWPSVTAALMSLAAALMIAVLLLLLRWRSGHLARYEALHARAGHLTVALWGSGEQFWDFDLERRELHLLQAEEGGDAPGEDLVLASRMVPLPRVQIGRAH